MKNIIKNSQKRFGRIILVIINILLILAAVLSSLVYSDHIRNEKTQMQIDAFCSTMEGMMQVSGNLSEDGEGICRELGKLHRTPEYDDG